MGKRAGKVYTRLVCFAVAIFFCLALYPARAAENKNTLRVAFINQGALTSVSEDGKRDGYEYEYLQEIAQYTGWSYEFVDFEGSNEGIMAAMEQLKSGEVDLMTAMIYMESLTEDYDYAAYSHGAVNTVLGVFDDNVSITESNLFQNRKLRVAVTESARTRINELEQFCAMSKIEVEKVVCDNREGQRSAVRDGRADVLLETDLNLPGDMRAVARFASRPFYFAGAKGKGNMMSRLNAALLNINETDPYFSVSLYEKYFGDVDTSIHLSEEEEGYVRGAGTLRVAVFPERMPLQGVDSETGEYIGVTRDVFDYIARTTGLQFQYVPLATPDELQEHLAAGTVDLVAGMPYDYSIADICGLVMSRPYITAQETYAVAKTVNPQELKGKRLAIPKGGGRHDELTDRVTEYDTLRQCLDALERGEADFAINDNYTLQYYANLREYKNVRLVPQTGSEQRFCIGLGKPVNAALLTILNKAIRSLEQDDLQAMIYRNATAPTKVTFRSFVEDNPLLVLGCILTAALVVIWFLFIYFRARVRTSRREALENERYKQLSELTNEHIFEYDYRKDRFSMSERSAKAIGIEPVRENYLFRLRQNLAPAAERERELFERLRREKALTEDVQIHFANGTRRWIRIAAKVISDAAGKPVLTVGRMTDIQAEREERERLEEKAQRDSLTGLYNAETTRELVSARLADSANLGGALLVLDVDQFKSINDRCGHFMGDQALTAVARLLESTFRRNDVVGRLGGDEFVVYMDGITERAVVEEKCQQLLAGMASLDGPMRELHLTVSIGAVMAEGEKDYNRLYQHSDKALYRVKEGGRNGYCLA